jgi:Tol biopolymer transport system component
VSEGARIEGRVYAGIGCGTISPDERWMLFEVDHSEELNHDFFERWAIDLSTDRRWFLEDQVECQADGLFLPAWSASGRYVYFGDCGYSTSGDKNSRGRIFLSDMVAGTTRQITTGVPSILLEPAWSPVADALAYRSRAGVVTLSDLGAGTLTAVPELLWPVKFDPTGTLLYSERSRLQDRTDTALYSVPAKRVIATLPGLPPARSSRSEVDTAFTPVMATQTGFVAVLEEAPGCQGATVYVDKTTLTCVIYGVGPTISPNGRYVALPRYDGFTGYTAHPGGGSSTMWRYEVVIVDLSTGDQEVAADGVLGHNLPISLPWNPQGTHILVRWPFSSLGP